LAEKITCNDYRKYFIENHDLSDKVSGIHKKAYEIASDNRKFEIENYWKRANYFWLFQVSVFTGYFYSVTADAAKNSYLTDNPVIIIGITCLGFLTALAWYLSNKGSKQWQNNWEEHVNLLGEGIAGPLYKISINESSWSVSRINELVSLFSVFVWILLGIKTLLTLWAGNSLVFIAYFLTISLIFFVFYFWGKGLGDYKEVQWYR